MRTAMSRSWSSRPAFLAAAMCLAAASATSADEGAKKFGPPSIYDTKADGDKQIAAALVKASRDNKRVLLQFGADWCIWCHRMHALLESDPQISKTMLHEYELVLIDIAEVDGMKHNAQVDARYGRPTRHGLPVWVVLGADGRQLTTIQTEPLESGDGYDTAKVLDVLNRWKAKPVAAANVLSDALARAKSQSKNVFLYFGAPWCAYCRRMDAFLRRQEIAEAFGSAFVAAKVDVDRMTGGKEMSERYGATEEDGIPFFVILDANGEKLADSRALEGNVGFPVEPFEIKHFMKLLEKTGKQLSATQLTLIETGLKKKL